MTCVLSHTSQTITAHYTWPIYWPTLTKTSLHTTHDPFTDPHSPNHHCILHMTHLLTHTHQNITAYYTWPMHWSTHSSTFSGWKCKISPLNICYVRYVLLWITYWLVLFESLLVFIFFQILKMSQHFWNFDCQQIFLNSLLIVSMLH